MRITCKSLAKELNLAQSTISMALQNHPRISPATRQRVRDAAQRLNYTPNHIARSMVTGKTRVIGFPLYSIKDEHIAWLFNGAMMAAFETGYLVKAIAINMQMSGQQIAQSCIENCVCAVVCAPLKHDRLNELSQTLLTRGIPMAVTANSFYDSQGLRVVADDRGGMKQAIEHLLHLGHRSIAYLDGDPEIAAAKTRHQGYLDALREVGIKALPQHQMATYFDPVQAHRAVRSMLNFKQRPTAIVSINDPMAMVAMRTARQLGFSVPKDLSIIGFSNLSMAEYADPPLTSVDQPWSQMGHTATLKLIQALEKNENINENWGQQIVMPTQLIVRESTAQAPDLFESSIPSTHRSNS